jgi:hypothetical protein
MLRQTTSFVLLMGIGALLVPGPSSAAKSGSDGANSTAATSTHFMLFDLPPAGSYDIRVNTAPAGSATAGPTGSIETTVSTNPGNQVQFVLTGITPVTPAAPLGFVAVGNTQGCVALSWNTPASGDYVNGYSLLWGTTPGVYTDSMAVDRLEVITTGTSSSARKCGFPSGTFHFALRAHNAFDLWSGLSTPSTTTISNENTVGPPAPSSVAVMEDPPGCAKVSWTASGDPTVTGYRVYLGTKPRAQGAYTDSTDVGLVTAASFCSLAPGKFYAAVRARTGTGVLSAYSKEVSLTVIGPDLTPPVVSGMSPADGATNVPRNTTVFFLVTDARSGVNFNSIVVRVDGQQCPGAVTPTPGGYAVQCQPVGMLPANSAISVTVSARDGASPANTVDVAWSFQTGADAVNDIDPPVIGSPSPAAGADNVAPGTAVAVTVTDGGLGVDLGSIVMVVDGATVEPMVEGTPASVRVTYRPQAPFPARRTVQVRVDACDRAGTANCAATFSFSFSIGNALTAAAPGAIVPDGFWADDPNRPMEVRNLPASWRVRIFDAAGTPVRHFTNNQPGITWSWDFRNDNGERVAPALYLVRVTDGSGSVQESGRFLVQSAQ